VKLSIFEKLKKKEKGNLIKGGGKGKEKGQVKAEGKERSMG